MYQYTSKDIFRFWSKVNKDGSIPAHCPELGHCWEWVRAKSSGGYGNFVVANRDLKAHRVAWELTNGAITDGLWVLHKCDNPACVNPDHLFLGTRQNNIDDMMNKRRHTAVKGEKNGNHKLTLKQVEFIRERYAQGGITLKELGTMMNVSFSLISHIINNRTWIK